MAIGHALGDYPLQGEFLATGKNRHIDSSTFFGGGEVSPILWVHSLTAHSLIQAGMVWIVTCSGALAALPKERQILFFSATMNRGVSPEPCPAQWKFLQFVCPFE